MASEFAITPDLQQIKQFEATSGRPVTSQAVQGITQQAIQTAAGRAEERARIDLQRQDIENRKSFQDQSLDLQRQEQEAKINQLNLDNQFRQTAFEAGQKQQAIQNQFSQDAADLKAAQFQQSIKVQAQNFGLAEKELQARIKNQTELVGLKKEQIANEARRVGVAESTLLLQQEAQKFNQDLAAQRFSLDQEGFKAQQSALKQARAIERTLLGEEFKQAAREKFKKNLISRPGFNNINKFQLQQFDARDPLSFLPKGA